LTAQSKTAWTLETNGGARNSKENSIAVCSECPFYFLLQEATNENIIKMKLQYFVNLKLEYSTSLTSAHHPMQKKKALNYENSAGLNIFWKPSGNFKRLRFWLSRPRHPTISSKTNRIIPCHIKVLSSKRDNSKKN
jgi:hypothetical protein